MQVKTRQPDPLLTEDQAADLLGVRPTTLQVWRCTRRYPLPYVKVGRNVRYRASALQAFIESRTVGAEA
jgi:excisionase family DNA binding protein